MATQRRLPARHAAPPLPHGHHRPHGHQQHAHAPHRRQGPAAGLGAAHPRHHVPVGPRAVRCRARGRRHPLPYRDVHRGALLAPRAAQSEAAAGRDAHDAHHQQLCRGLGSLFCHAFVGQDSRLVLSTPYTPIGSLSEVDKCVEKYSKKKTDFGTFECAERNCAIQENFYRIVLRYGLLTGSAPYPRPQGDKLLSNK